MRGIHRSVLKGTLAAVVASGVVVLATSGSASGALPAVCTSGAPNVRTFTGPSGGSWESPGNWTPASVAVGTSALRRAWTTAIRSVLAPFARATTM